MSGGEDVKKMKKCFSVRVLCCLILLFLTAQAVFADTVVTVEKSFHVDYIVFAVLILIVGAVAIYFFFLSRKKEDEVQQIFFYDDVTKLPNGIFAMSYMEEMKESRNGYAYCILQMKNFVELTSLFGTQKGNHTLEQVGKELSTALQESEIACSLQNGTFSLLIKLGEEPILERFAGILSRLEKLSVTDGVTEYSYHCKFFAGIYEITGEEEDVAEIVNMANLALSEASKKLDKKYVLFDKTRHKEVLEKRQLLSRINEAFEKREIQVHFQPQYELSNVSVCGAELLARWDHPELGLIRAVEFISLLEANERVFELDLYMLEEACKQIKKWISSERMPVPLWLNVSKYNLYETDFIGKVIDLAKTYSVPTNLIGFEIHSDILAVANKELEAMVLRYHQEGFLIAVDHFSPNSPMSILYDYPLSRVKVTSEYLIAAKKSVKVRAGMNNLMGFCTQLEIATCAKGISNQIDEKIFKDAMCEVGQGSLYAETFDMKQFEELIF